MSTVLCPDAVARLHTVQRLAGQDVISDLVRLFVRDTPFQLATLGEALARGDTRGARRAAHAIKGNAGALGATELQALCAALEDGETAATITAVADLVSQLDSTFQRARSALEALASEVGGSP